MVKKDLKKNLEFINKEKNSLFKYHHEEYILDIPELNKLWEQQEIYRKNKKNYYQKKKLLSKIIIFFDWYIIYCNNILKGRKYSDKLLIECVLRDTIKKKEQMKEYLLKSIYLSLEYVKHLKDKVSIKILMLLNMNY